MVVIIISVFQSGALLYITQKRLQKAESEIPCKENHKLTLLQFCLLDRKVRGMIFPISFWGSKKQPQEPTGLGTNLGNRDGG